MKMEKKKKMVKFDLQSTKLLYVTSLYQYRELKKNYESCKILRQRLHLQSDLADNNFRIHNILLQRSQRHVYLFIYIYKKKSVDKKTTCDISNSRKAGHILHHGWVGGASVVDGKLRRYRI